METVILDKIPTLTETRLIDGEEIEIEVEINDPLYVTKSWSGKALYHPKWTGTEWVEGLEQTKLDEIEYQQYLDSLKPSEDEVKKAQMELLVMNLLFDMEVM